MITKMTKHYKMDFYENYVIVERKENVLVNAQVTKDNLKIVIDHFKGKEFVIISNRKHSYTLNAECYSPSLFKKVKGIAIVSDIPDVKAQAILEQMNFKNSFAFFDNLEDAQNWAQSFSYSY